MTLDEMLLKRDQMFNRLMQSSRLAAVYYDGAEGSPEELKLVKKLKDPHQAVEDEMNNDCGCGKTMRENMIQALVRELETAAQQLGV